MSCDDQWPENLLLMMDDVAANDTNAINVTEIPESSVTAKCRFSWSDFPHSWLDRYCSIPASLLGIVGSLVSLTVWSTQTSHTATILLFTYLAVWDTTFLVMLVTCLLDEDVHEVLWFLLGTAHDYCSLLSFTVHTSFTAARIVFVHTTLMVGVCRWVAVRRPPQVYTGSLLRRRQVLAVIRVLLVLCLVIVNPFVLALRFLPMEVVVMGTAMFIFTTPWPWLILFFCWSPLSS